MKLFKDATGREWTIELNITTIAVFEERIRTFLDENFDIFDPGEFMNRTRQIKTTANLLYLVCKDQADERGLTDVDFGRLLFGLVFYEARKALVAEYVDFFPDPTVQRALRTVEEKDADGKDRLERAILESMEARIQSALRIIANDTNADFSTPSP